MTEEQNLSVSSMVRQTGTNTQTFLEHVAAHIEMLENEIVRLNQIIDEKNNSKKVQDQE